MRARHPRIMFLLLCSLTGAAWAGWETCRTLAGDLSRAALNGSKRRVAVIGFSSETGARTKACSIIAGRLTSELASEPDIELVEREKLAEVLGEQELGAGGALDPLTVKKIGSVLGADMVVTGTVIELDGESVEVNARLVDAHTGRILRGVSGKMKKDWDGPMPAQEGPEAGYESPEPVPPDRNEENCGGPPEESEMILLGVNLEARALASGLTEPCVNNVLPGRADFGAGRRLPNRQGTRSAA